MFKALNRNELARHPDFLQSSVHRTLIDRPLGFIDIGARGGTHDMVEPIAERTAVLGFEPDAEECERLLDSEEVTSPWAQFALEAIALAETDKEAKLYLLSAATNHSLLPPNTEFTRRYNMVKFEEVGSTSLRTVTLDSVLFGPRQKETQWGEFIKIDTQGTEYEIFAGAPRTLTERTVAIVAEVAFFEIYKGQKLFSEVEQQLREKGFSFFGFMPMHTRSRKLLDKRSHITVERAMYTDAIFFKDPLAGNPKNISLSARQQHLLFTVALLLNFYDYALELAQSTWLKDADDIERARIERLVKDISALPADKNAQAVEQLAAQIKATPELANVVVGNFVDRRRRVCDFDDILNISPLPKTL
jgi:FkbM family methyltransferase